MSTEIEDLERRVAQLERHFGAIDRRLALIDVSLKLSSAGRRQVAAAIAEADDGAPGEPTCRQQEVPVQGPAIEQIEAMMGSMLLHQADHTVMLRKAVRYLERLVQRNAS